MPSMQPRPLRNTALKPRRVVWGLNDTSRHTHRVCTPTRCLPMPAPDNHRHRSIHPRRRQWSFLQPSEKRESSPPPIKLQTCKHHRVLMYTQSFRYGPHWHVHKCVFLAHVPHLPHRHHSLLLSTTSRHEQKTAFSSTWPAPPIESAGA